ncbi:MAG: DUF3025 domain-containing protein [Gammaproteobacteria bacterium]|nr:DUF3025 domain-containing protein [Gammaproteobacteria bacterium]
MPALHGWRADFAVTAPFHHVAHLAEPLAGADWPTLQRLNHLAEAQGLRNAAGLPLRFAAQHVRCGQWDYEAGILASGVVPSREGNWHDLLNALTWLTFPHAKAALNAVQCDSLEQRRGSTRGARSDAATLFDESGVLLLACDDELAELLAARRWQEAFVLRRLAWQNVRVYAFGHAVLEKLLAPWPGITAKCLFLRVDSLPEAGLPATWLDAALAKAWRDGRVSRPADLFPLPVLGVPGWWPANDDAAFYLDRRVFRPLPGVADDVTQSA